MHSNILVNSKTSVSQVRQNLWVPIRAACLALFLLSGAAHATPPQFNVPIDCIVSEDCWVVNLVDRDPGPGFADFRCGPVGYDGHRGVDIAVANRARMMAGVSVVAAADGKVRAIRDGVPETRPEDINNAGKFAGRECGNGVVIDHGDGWSSQYCHLKAGTVSVSKGQHVVSGDHLGDVGLSGVTEFPHVHFVVRNGNTVIDPYTNSTQVAKCAATGSYQSLWSDDALRRLKYPGPQPYHLGFAAGKPDVTKVRAGLLNHARLRADAPALVFWAEAFTLAKGDAVSITFRSPDGSVIGKSSYIAPKPSARRYWYVGKKKPSKGWVAGNYVGQIDIRRGDKTVTRRAVLVVE